MPSHWEQLEAAFVNDHRTMTQGYVDLINSLESKDIAMAVSIASRLDQLAGPHIEFEEKYLYPKVQTIRGEDYVSKLYGEHNAILGAIIELRSLQPDAMPPQERIDHWIAELRHGLDHAAACGSLLSHLQTLPADTHQRFHESLQRLRVQGHRWSQLHTTPDP